MGAQPARWSSVRPRVASIGCILASVLHAHAAEHGRTFDVQPLDPGHVRVGLYALVAKAAEDRDNLTHHDPVRRNLEVDAAEHAGDVDNRRVPTHAGAPQIDPHAAEHGGDLAAAKIVRDHLAVHAAEKGVLIQRALVRPRRDVGGTSAPTTTRTPPVIRPLDKGESTILTTPTAIRTPGQKRQMS